MQISTIRILAAIAALGSAGIAKADTSTDTSTTVQVDPIHNPDHLDAVKGFDWQKEWGSLHINSYADGLNDPGTLATSNGQVPCGRGVLCNSATTNAGSVSNGIKFDIKNSVVNCLSKQIPNWANQHGEPDQAISYETGACNSVNLTPGFGTGSPVPKALLYMPFYDARSNDLQTIDSGQKAGCLQQLTNTCGDTTRGVFVRDIHSCLNTNPSRFPSGCADGQACDVPGAAHPVTHVFTPEEVADFGGTGSQIPTKYYTYLKKTDDGKTRPAVSKTDPTGRSDVDGSQPVTLVDNTSDPILARLKSVRIETTEDDSKFIIMDPSDLFDLNLYVSGGKYDTGYAQFDPATHNVMSPETCPVLGITGYGGICDPTGRAGCNIPIYGVGASTTFTDSSGISYTYNHYPIKWSGYAKQWSVITPAHYYQEISGRESIYSKDEYVNRNPIIRLVRANEYCEDAERSSAVALRQAAHDGVPPHPDMAECVQYLQYMEVNSENNTWAWMDLYQPDPDNLDLSKPRLDYVRLYDIGADGKPDVSHKVPGTGNDKYIGGDGSHMGFVSLKDDVAHTPSAVYFDHRYNQHTDPANYGPHPAVERLAPVQNQAGEPTAGRYLNGVDKTAGTGVSLDRGTTAVIRMPDPLRINNKEVTCASITVAPPVGNDANADAQVFVPTNTHEEVQRFLDALSARPANGVAVRDCISNFAPNTVDGMPNTTGARRALPVGTTWWGMTDCSQLTTMPSCNEAKLISAQRLCQYENGMFADCEACQALAEPDAPSVYAAADAWDANWEAFSSAHPGMSIEVAPHQHGTRGDRCKMVTACMNVSSTSCPAVTSSGGHVFCFAGETKITMADGKQKAISKIKAGEKVMAFDAKHTRNSALVPAVVKATAVTKKQKIVKINDLRVTPLHKIVLANGRSVAAQDIKIGDRIMTANGLIELVTTIDKNLPATTVYNLVLEDGKDGYIAGGKRVMSYPILKGMEGSNVELAKAKKPHGASRHTSSLKSPR